MSRSPAKPHPAGPRPELSDARPPAESVKETIDSIIIALSLALVFRAFIVEAFVIPTGSMADTLLGKHRQFVCKDCGYVFNVGVREREEHPRQFDSDQQMREKEILCPSCGEAVAGEEKQLLAAFDPDRAGDKILVFKFPYIFQEPQRWDVIVFYNPANPEQNFIKRLIGLPGEALQIVDGDLWAGKDKDHLEIQRKPRQVQQALWHPVYLNDYWPKRHVPGKDDEIAPDAAESGKADAERTFPRWVHYSGSAWGVGPPRNDPQAGGRQFVFSPSPAATRGDPLFFKPDRLKLGFLDYFGYNQFPLARSVLNVVWDLRLEAVVFFKEAGGAIELSMNRHEDRFTATIRQEGQVELTWVRNEGRPDETREKVDWFPKPPRQPQPFPLNQGIPLALENVDFRAAVWIGNTEVASHEYGPRDGLSELRANDRKRAETPTGPDGLKESDVPLVWMKGNGNKAMEVWHVNLYRDDYYTDQVEAVGVASRVLRGTPIAPEEQVIELKKYGGGRDPDDEFFVLGDNSPSSADGRLWSFAGGSAGSSLPPYWHLEERKERGRYRAGRVPRDHLIGKAFFVYWPAGLMPWPNAFQSLVGHPLPLVPNVGQMRLIH